MIIIGAGMAGCIAAFMNRKALICESAATPPDNHRAVLRFRSNVVAEITGIPFRKVLVRKGVWSAGAYVKPTIRLANMYSKKVIYGYQNRSIWNLEPVERYIAPPDFHPQMLDVLKDRICYDSAVKEITQATITINGTTHSRIGLPFDKIINTAPMPVISKIAKRAIDVAFRYAPIQTWRATVRNADVHQTVYFPDRETPVYRATIVGDQLIIEATDDITLADQRLVAEAFAIDMAELSWENGSRSQRYGKISPIPDHLRRSFMLELTLHLNVYSLGRFATWRNILLDDVVDDMNKIQRMNDQYAAMRVAF